MAFPTTITTDGLATRGIAGPFVSSGGNVYVIVTDDDRFDVRALKATDPSASFAGVGTDIVVGASSDIIYALAGYQVGDVIHVVSKNGVGNNPVDIRYHAFDMSSDTWTTSNEMIKTNVALASGQHGFKVDIAIVVRSDGHKVVIYNGATETVASTPYDRVYYARHQGAAWTADFALGPAGVAASWVGGEAILGALDRVHFFFHDATNGDLYQRTLTSAYVLETLPASIDTAVEDPENSWGQRGAFITSTGVVSFPYYDSFQTINQATFTSSDTPVVVINTDITGSRAALTEPKRFVAAHAADGTTLWNAFLDTANDIYLQSKVGGDAWSTPAGFLTTGASAIFASVYTRGSALVLGMVFHDTDPKYHEYTLSVIAAASTGIPNGFLLMGVGR